MPSLRNETPKSFKDFVILVEKYQSKSHKPLWFRGCGSDAHKLLPTLYRHRRKKSVADLEQLESQLVMRFRQRSIPFHGRNLGDEWDALFFMQHYGVPTRLLDWTENPFIAFYFAVMSGKSKAKWDKASDRPALSFSSNAAVWILDPIVWNAHALNHVGYDRGVLTPADEALPPYKPLTKFKDMNVLPVALYGAHNSPRIVAQRGVFTIFGKHTGTMEEAYRSHDFPKDSLVKVTLNRLKLPGMRSSILNQGISESVVFPDLDGLAREMKREFGFED
jgi:hypothetical protein